MTVSEFSKELDALRTQHLTQISGFSAEMLPVVPTGDPGIDGPGQTCIYTARNDMSGAQSDATSSAQAVKDAGASPGAQQTFQQQMEAQKQQQIANQTNNINSAYAQWEAYGNANPDKQSSILAAANAVGSTVTSAIQSFVKAVSDIIQSILNIINDLSKIVQAFAPVFAILASIF
jgi:oligoendopeptidase F